MFIKKILYTIHTDILYNKNNITFIDAFADKLITAVDAQNIFTYIMQNTPSFTLRSHFLNACLRHDNSTLLHVYYENSPDFLHDCYHNMALFTAVDYEACNALVYILQNIRETDKNLLFFDKEYFTPVHFAIQQNKLAALYTLMEIQPNITHSDGTRTYVATQRDIEGHAPFDITLNTKPTQLRNR